MGAETEEVWVESYHAATKRHAVLQGDNLTAWLYLHEPSEDPGHTGPIKKACFVYNRIAPIDAKDAERFQPAPPPIAKGHASKLAICKSPMSHEWAINWAKDGSAVLLRRDGEGWCIIEVSGDKYGFSKSISAEGPWGSPWDQRRFEHTAWSV